MRCLGHSPREDEAQQGAEEDEHLVEHGRLCAQDGTVEVILQRMRPAVRRQGPQIPHAYGSDLVTRPSCPVLVTLTSVWSQDGPHPGVRSRYARGQIIFDFKTVVTAKLEQG